MSKELVQKKFDLSVSSSFNKQLIALLLNSVSVVS